MRTVSFSEPTVRSLLNRNFVNTFSNTKGDPTSGQSIDHAPESPSGNCIRGNGKQNVQTIFMTPDGEIYHVATGFLSGEDLAHEASFALELFKKMRRKPEAESELVVAAHQSRLSDNGFSENEIKANNPISQMAMMGFPGLNGSGSKNVNGRNGNSIPGDVFGGFIKRQFLEDNKFPIQYPLLSWEQLEEDPAKLVGNGKSFFSSSSSNFN